ncbi:hypothetical protein DH2020_043498 [Rehmannia glutinosa]|uniref:Uncharacterized protein n=1 Tax=Rehmannia glutinosa TaxID=99300 RepID=A0ABR0ULB3_REHGL
MSLISAPQNLLTFSLKLFPPEDASFSAQDSTYDSSPPLTNSNHIIMALWWFSNRKIHKVPQLLRQEERNGNYYDPEVVSFGPYHHGKADLQLCQEAKHLALHMFLEGSGQSREFFFSKVVEVIADARNCYIDGSTDIYTDEEFAEMMLLDACFLIYYILIYYMDIDKKHQELSFLMYNNLGRLVLSLVNHDIFLMENQIPFRILVLLIDLRYNNDWKGEEALNKFLHKSVWGQYRQQQIQGIQQQQKKSQPLDLFEAFHRVLTWDWTPQRQVKLDQQEDVDLKKYHKIFRSVKDLKAKGIRFKPSYRKSLNDIIFHSYTFFGQLQLPIWFESNLSKVFFLNMIAYELCPNNLVDTTVISYVNFMKSLIDSPDDVKELREKRILLTTLESDEEVVQLYRDLNTYGMGSMYSFQEVKQRIQEHYDSKTKTWMAELIHNYFSNPWSFIAWFAGLLLLVLTFMQTYFTINTRD